MKALIVLLTLIVGALFTVLVAQTQVELQFDWDASTCTGQCVNGVDGYRLYKEDGTLLQTLPPTPLTYVLSNYQATAGQQECFFLASFNEDGESAPSNVACVTVPATGPNSPVLRVGIR